MSESRHRRSNTTGRGAARRRAASGVVAGYMHERSDRHRPPTARAVEAYRGLTEQTVSPSGAPGASSGRARPNP
jgi:hypothetical protein